MVFFVEKLAFEKVQDRGQCIRFDVSLGNKN
jgi:hypothetical protein